LKPIPQASPSSPRFTFPADGTVVSARTSHKCYSTDCGTTYQKQALLAHYFTSPTLDCMAGPTMASVTFPHTISSIRQPPTPVHSDVSKILHKSQTPTIAQSLTSAHHLLPVCMRVSKTVQGEAEKEWGLAEIDSL
jgi:hypothetical protein